MNRILKVAAAALCLLWLSIAGTLAAPNGAVTCPGLAPDWENFKCPDLNEELSLLFKRSTVPLTSVSGTDTYSALSSPFAITGYFYPQTFDFEPPNTNTGPSTLNVNSLGAIAIVSQAGVVLSAGDLQAGTKYTLRYYGAPLNQFRVLDPLGSGVAPASAPFLVVSNTSSLSLERALTAGKGIGFTDGGANSSFTISLLYSYTLAGNPALGANECGFSSTGAGGGFVCEGSVADNFEGNFKFPDVTGSDQTQTVLTDASPAGGDLTGTYPNPTIGPNSVALGPDTTNNYAAGDAEAGNALAGDSATAFFPTGFIEVARGGNGAAPGGDDQVFVSSSTSAGTFVSIPDSDAATQKLQYDTATNSFIAATDDDIPDAADYTNLSATSPITQSGGTISTSISTGRLVGRTTASAGVMEQITPDATLLLAAGGLGVVDVTCTGCLGTTEIAALDAADITTGALADARVDGSLEADEVNPTLGSQTQGNYQQTTAAGTGIAVSGADAEGSTKTVSLDYSDAGASPSLGADECRFSGDATTNGELVCEGDTADAFETRIVVTDPTADRVYTIPNADSNPVRPFTCSGSDKVSAIAADGTITCTADSGAAGGDSGSLNGSALNDFDLDDATPAAASGGVNVLWQKDASSPNNVSAYVPAILGKKTIAVPAGSLKPRATDGCSINTFPGTNVEVPVCDFIDGTDKKAQFTLVMPKSADESAGIDASFTWTTSTASNAVIWTLACVAISDDDVLDTAMGTLQSVTDTVTAANDQMTTSFTATITPGNSWTEGDKFYCEVTRDANAGGDTHTGTARLLSITIRYTINALRDD